MRKRTRRTLVAGAGAALVVVGGGAALAAQSSGDPGAESQAVVNDAARQLGVDPAKLGAALKQALANRVDAAVKSGRLTEEQGTALKQRLEAGAFPLFGGHGLRGPGHHRGFGHLEAAASYLGLSETALRTNLEGGTSLAEVAQERDKSVDGLIDALVAAELKELDAAVAAGELTADQRARVAAGLKARITALVNGTRPGGGPSFFRGRHGFGGPPHSAPQAA